MIDILIAEDEPAPARYLKSLIELHSPQLRVQGVAMNGEEALELAEQHCPDIVFTDVRMPVMDGIALVSVLKVRFPLLPTIIVSGHQEFDYARQALALGVVDYLLKPVDPLALGQLLDRLVGSLEQSRTNLRLRYRENLLMGKVSPRDGERYWIGIVRWGGPLSSREWGVFEGIPWRDGIDQFSGRDKRESVYLANSDETLRDVFEATVRETKNTRDFRTSTFSFPERAVDSTDLPSMVRTLFQTLDQTLTVGTNKIHWGRGIPPTPLTIDSVRVQELRLCLQDSAVHRLKDVVRRQVEQWLMAGMGTRQILDGVRHILLVIQREAPRSDSGLDWESRLDQGAAEVDCPEDLLLLAIQTAVKASGLESGLGNQDAPESFQTLLRFLGSHFPEPLSLDGVCEQFGISQTYLSRLFRKHRDCTFHEYLTRLRMDAAERLLRENPTFTLKVVAASVGYQDPFHFSKAFKAIKGISPSEIRAED